MSLGFGQTELALFGELWMQKGLGETPTFDTRFEMLDVLKEGLYSLAARKSTSGDEKMLEQINGFQYELHDMIHAM